MIVSLLFAEADPFDTKISNSKHEIVDSLIAVDQLSGSIYYQQNYITVDANWMGGHSYIGDYWDMGWMVHFASIGYLSFEIPLIPEGFELQSATLRINYQSWSGNSEGGYPVFNIGGGAIYPVGVLEHIDYGETFNSNDVIPSSIYGYYPLFNQGTFEPQSLVSYDISDCMISDILRDKTLNQYRLYLQGFSDWDIWDDYVVYSSFSSIYGISPPKIIYTLKDGTSNHDPSNPVLPPQLSYYPNPFSEQCRILFKTPEAGSSNMKIYNTKGQLIRTHSGEYKKAGDHSFQWDGKDDNGKQVSGGIYLAVVEAGKNTARSKIIFMK
jgi:hypothetical protein